MSKNNGGPAFPSSIVDDSLHVPGMTLRDYFAAKAMQGFCVVTVDDSPIGDWKLDYLAKHAYLMADAMLAEREKDND
jgi:hypothetical protein